MGRNIKLYALLILLLVWINSGAARNNPAADTLKLLATGDTMLGSWVGDVLADSGMSYPFQHLQAVLTDTDIFFTNLEAPFGVGGQAFPKQYTFQVDPSLVAVLTGAGINLVSLGNNHIMDFGAASLQETVALLDQHGIRYAGAGMNLTEARRAAVWEVNGRTIGFLSYSLTFPREFWATDSSAGTSFPYQEFVFKDVARLSRVCDVVIVSCHWGQELRETPKDYQVLLAHQLIDKGADIILGHHPHVVQGLEWYKGKLIAYSLGNFIFGSYSERVKESIILKINIASDDTINAEVIPINVYNKAVNFSPKPLQGKKRGEFLQHLERLSSELSGGAFGITKDGRIIGKPTNQKPLTGGI